MRGFAVFVLVLVALALASAKPTETEETKEKIDTDVKPTETEETKEKYVTKYDNVDLQEILKNKRLLNNYIACLKGTGKCSPDGTELKSVLPDALENGCTKCSEKQRDGSKTVIRHLIKHESEQWAELSKIYDPKGEYTTKYREDAKKEGIEI